MRKTDRNMDPAGVLLIDKAPQWTSHDVVDFIRRFGFKKVGHCGSLDPAATGLLVILIGRATKLSERFAKQDKIYEGVMEIGKETSTHDIDGEIIQQCNWSGISEDTINMVFQEFVGEQQQIPPMVSAIKYKGEALYKLARKGIVVERKPRLITIHRLEVRQIKLPEIDFLVHCSKGTYIRTLCADIGTHLKRGAYLKQLRRLESGHFHLDNATSISILRSWNKDILLQNMIPFPAVFDYLY